MVDVIWAILKENWIVVVGVLFVILSFFFNGAGRAAITDEGRLRFRVAFYFFGTLGAAMCALWLRQFALGLGSHGFLTWGASQGMLGISYLIGLVSLACFGGWVLNMLGGYRRSFAELGSADKASDRWKP